MPSLLISQPTQNISPVASPNLRSSQEALFLPSILAAKPMATAISTGGGRGFISCDLTCELGFTYDSECTVTAIERKGQFDGSSLRPGCVVTLVNDDVTLDNKSLHRALKLARHNGLTTCTLGFTTAPLDIPRRPFILLALRQLEAPPQVVAPGASKAREELVYEEGMTLFREVKKKQKNLKNACFKPHRAY